MLFSFVITQLFLQSSQISLFSLWQLWSVWSSSQEIRKYFHFFVYLRTLLTCSCGIKLCRSELFRSWRNLSLTKINFHYVMLRLWLAFQNVKCWPSFICVEKMNKSEIIFRRHLKMCSNSTRYLKKEQPNVLIVLKLNNQCNN